MEWPLTLALRSGQVDLIGHTLLGMETPDFYQAAQELDWFVDTKPAAAGQLPRLSAQWAT
jgi:hypothetical protein